MSRDLKIISTAMLTWGLGEGMFFIFQPLYIQQFGADPVLIGTILGINGLVMTVGQLPAGTAILIGQAGMGLFSALLWQGTGLFWYGAAYLFLGGYRLIRAMTLAWVRPVVRAKEVGLAFGMVETVNSLAFAVAPVLAGFLYDWRPISIFPVSLGVLAVTIALSLAFTRWHERVERTVLVPVTVEVEVEDEA